MQGLFFHGQHITLNNTMIVEYIHFYYIPTVGEDTKTYFKAAVGM